MKIEFDDTSFIEFINSSPGKISIVLGARDHKNPLNIVVNSAEVTIEELKILLNDINIEKVENSH